MISKVELAFEIKEDNKLNENKCGIVLTDLKILGAMWDSTKKTIKKSE